MRSGRVDVGEWMVLFGREGGSFAGSLEVEGEFICYWNYQRSHQGIGYLYPADIYSTYRY